MKRRLLVLTNHDVYGDQPNGTIYAMQTLLAWLSEGWEVDVYSLQHRAKPSPRASVTVHRAPPLGKKRLTWFLDRHLDNLLIRYFRRGFNRLLERTVARVNRGKPSPKSYYSKGQVDNLKAFLEDRDYSGVIVEYVYNTYLLEALEGRSIPKLLDMHDVMHLRSESFARMHISHKLHFDRETEYAMLARYDYLLAIQCKEASYLRREFGEKVLCVPRPFEVMECPLAAQPSGTLVLSFLASKALFNLHAYDWFVENVWQQIQGSGVGLEVAGTLCLVIGRPRLGGIEHLGVVEKPGDAYVRSHVMINPVQVGSGLKIKNVEALAHGRPVITTSLGAEGLEGAIGRGLMIADSAEAFREAVLDLRQRPDEVTRLSQQAKQYVAEEFSPRACFGELAEALSRIPLAS